MTAPTLTPAQTAQVELASRVLSKRRLLPFVQRINPRYTAGWVHEDICRRLEQFSEDVAAGLSPRLMLLMPPRAGKSELASRMFPSWHLGRYPDHEIIACAYNVSLAMSFSRKVKEAMDDPSYQSVFDARLHPDFRSNEEWGLSNGRGGYVAAGVGGGITGKGAHCLPAGEMVSTTEGAIDIEHLYQLKSPPRVLTPFGPRRILAATRREADDLYTLTFASGRVLRTTGKHPLYLPDREGYATVESLYGQAQNNGRLDVRVVREALPAPALRLREVGEAGVEGVLLQQDVQSGAPCDQERAPLRDVPHTSRAERLPERKILLPGVPPETAQPTRESLRGMRRGVSAEVFKDGLLRQGLRQYGAQQPDDWGGELALQGRQFLRILVRPDEAPDHGARQGVRSVPDGRSPAHPPSGREPPEQWAGELGADVRFAPHNPPQVEYDTISLVEPVRGIAERVYDLQVEDAGCFFAGQVLVGNCLIIDDPIKNAEEADSADVREKLWDWYGSTAYTRLAPGGGVLVIQCMTGDTPVMLPDGTERRLDALRKGDEVATFDDGRLGVSKVAAWKSSGRDLVYTITMNSGKMVRANGRHPFLVSIAGELKWIRTKHLTTDHTIVVLRDSAASGSAKPVQQMDASSQQSAGASAAPTTGRKNGLMGIAHHPSIQSPSESGTSNTAMGSRLKRTLRSWLRKAAGALSAGISRTTGPQGIGVGAFASTTTTTLAKSADCSATTVMPPQGTPARSALPSHWPSTSEFTTDAVRSVELTSEEEVFDVQIDRTENFIANGLVSHNTWWHDDDLAGRLQNAMAADPESDQFVVIKYPAIAEHDEYLDTDTDLIVYEPPEHGRALRAKGEALHPERYDLIKLNRIRKTIPPRFWSALYQQNPVPDDGAYFTKDMFRRTTAPAMRECNVYVAFDFAISEKKQNDYTVGVVGLQDRDDVLHVVDMVRFKSGDGMFIVEAILNLAQKWYIPGLQLGFEDGQIYRAIESLIKKRMKERGFYPSVVVLKPISDKMARARPLQGRMQQGMVSFTDQADWYEGARNEMLRFPAGVHDDQVDAIAWMTNMAVGRSAPRAPTEKPKKSWRDRVRSLGTSGGGHMAA